MRNELTMPGIMKDAYETARRRTKAAKRSVDDEATGMSAMLNDLAEMTRRYVVQNPVRTMAIAVGLGLFLGHRRRRR